MNGKWDHGYFSLSPVGAYNVGSIELSFEGKIHENGFNSNLEMSASSIELRTSISNCTFQN